MSASAPGCREIRFTTPPIAPAPYKRRRDAFDHLDLFEIHRRDLQQAQPAHLAEERQAVRQEARVAAAHALHAHARRAERRRGRLHAHAAHLVQHHDDVARRHEHLLFDLFALEHFDAQRLVLEPAAGARGADGDRDLNLGWLLFGGGAPGLYRVGLNFLRRRKSSFIHGAEDDAREIVEHLVGHLAPAPSS